MKKIVLILIVVVAVLATFSFIVKSSVNSEIKSKVEEIRASGFDVSYNERFSIFSIKADGEVKITNPKEALNYIVSLQEYEEQRENLQRVFESFDEYLMSQIFEGMVYEYDLNFYLLTSDLDLNIYLTKLSTILMQELDKSRQKQKVQLFIDMLKNRDIHINLDEDLNYKLKDINLSNEDFEFILKGVNGSKSDMNIDLFELTTTKAGVNIRLENIETNYKESSKDEMISDFSIEKINFFADKFDFKIDKLKISSFSKVLQNLLNNKTNISFDKFYLNKIDYYEDELKTELKNIDLNFDLQNFPFQEYKDFLNAYATMNIDMQRFFEKAQILLEAISDSKSNIKLKADSKDFIFQNLPIFKELKIDGDIIVSENLNNMNFSNANDIFEKLYFEIKVDKESVKEAIIDGRVNRRNEIVIIETEDKKYNLFKIELKEDGIFVNDSFKIR